MSGQFVNIHADAYDEIRKGFTKEQQFDILAQLARIERERALPSSMEVFGSGLQWRKLTVVILGRARLYFSERQGAVQLVMVARDGNPASADEAAMARL